ncbi:MAG: MerR family transcriptional regulator [Agathobacter sp.]|nr:MerR family transcriptional regulator [Agathobacter sp.]
MKNYFTISEFAKLRDININSLRYYEKLGLLKPAVVDDNTGYRYYSAEQVSILNKIILCIQLGIPLKEMVQFLDEEGNLRSQQLLEKGRIIAQKRIQEMQNNLDYIDYSLKNIEENKVFSNETEVYERYFEERKIMVTDYYTDYLEPKHFLAEISKIYKYAQKNGMFPILPAGQILKIDEAGQMKFCFFLEILNCDELEEKVFTIPAGVYSCVQVELEENLNFMHVIQENWNAEGEKTFVVNNVMLEKYSFENRPSELQKLEFDGLNRLFFVK